MNSEGYEFLQEQYLTGAQIYEIASFAARKRFRVGTADHDELTSEISLRIVEKTHALTAEGTSVGVGYFVNMAKILAFNSKRGDPRRHEIYSREDAVSDEDHFVCTEHITSSPRQETSLEAKRVFSSLRELMMLVEVLLDDDEVEAIRSWLEPESIHAKRIYAKGWLHREALEKRAYLSLVKLAEENGMGDLVASRNRDEVRRLKEEREAFVAELNSLLGVADAVLSAEHRTVLASWLHPASGVARDFNALDPVLRKKEERSAWEALKGLAEELGFSRIVSAAKGV